MVDQLQFPGGTGNVPATLSFDITYTKSGAPRKIAPTSADPLSAFHWAGKMWDAANSGTFSLTYNDNTFSVGGTFSSSGLFGEMGTERNGVFLNGDKIDAESAPAAAGLVQSVEPPEPAVLPAPLRARIRRPPR